MNSLLCHIRQQISDLQTSMLGGPLALPPSLLPTVYSLQEELIPVAWTHPNQQPCTHSLTSWLDGTIFELFLSLTLPDVTYVLNQLPCIHSLTIWPDGMLFRFFCLLTSPHKLAKQKPTSV